MGNCIEPKNKQDVLPPKEIKGQEASNGEQASKKSAPKSWEINRAKLNPKDYEFKGKEGETLLKKPGEINGQQFVVDSCTKCNIYLCDHSETVLIDDCTDCNFFIGPLTSSIFIRTTKNSKFIIACQQFRTRDLESCDFMLFCNTQPIIESSSKLRFGCFQFGYFELQQQFMKAELNVWNNDWSNIHNFTKKATPSHSYLPEDLHPYSFIPRISSFPEVNFVDEASEDNVNVVVPLSVGLRDKVHPEEALILIPPGYENQAEQLIPLVHEKKNDLYFIRTKAIALLQDQLATLLPQKNEREELLDGAKVNYGKHLFILIYFGGTSIDAQLKEVLSTVFVGRRCYHIWNKKASITPILTLVYETWSDQKEIKK